MQVVFQFVVDAGVHVGFHVVFESEGGWGSSTKVVVLIVFVNGDVC